MHRTIGQDHVIDSTRSFLRSRYPLVGNFVITSMDTNVPNPFEDTWDYWGTHMILVFRSGEVSWTRLGPYTSVPFELGLYASKNREELRYNGRVCGGVNPPAVPQWGRGHADVVRARETVSSYRPDWRVLFNEPGPGEVGSYSTGLSHLLPDPCAVFASGHESERVAHDGQRVIVATSLTSPQPSSTVTVQ